MQYKIIIDKQASSNPSNEKKEYIIDIEELRVKGNVYDSLNIEMDRTYVTRRLSLSEYGVLSELDKPIVQELTDVDIKLFEGDNYIYLLDMQGNKFYAEYLVKNDFTDLYVTTNQMNSAITQTAQNIELSVNQKFEGYSTTEEMYSAIELSSSTIMIEVNKKIGEEEFGTQIEMNYESVQIAWNTISEYIQLTNAELQILNRSKNKLMTLNTTGQHFFDNNSIFAEMGVETVEDNRYIAFTVPCDYGEDIADGMAWGIQTTSDNKFWPILYVKNFHMANKNAGDFSGELVLSACNLNLEGINSAITCGNVKMTTAGVMGGIVFLDEESEDNLLSITPQTTTDYAQINILDKISFFKNSAGSNSFKVGINSNYCMMTDEGELSSLNLFVWEDATVLGEFINTSLEEKKKNMKKLENGLDIVLTTDIYSYNLKNEDDNTKKHIGFIIGNKFNYSEKITSKKNDGANLYSMISVAYKAIQEQQEQIDKIIKKLEVIQ